MFDTVSQNDELRLQILSRRLKAVSAGAPFAVLSSFASAMVLLGIFRHALGHPLVFGWAAALACLLVARLVLLRITNVEVTVEDYLRQRLSMVTGVIMAVSLVWSAIFPLLALVGEAWALPALSAVGAAMFAGVLLIHRTIPAAGYFHIATMAAGLAAAVILVGGTAAWPMLALIVIYAVTLWAAVGRNDRQFVSGIAAEIESREAAETVAMLLHDYEEHSTDWLWCTGPQGNLRDVVPRFAAALGTDVDSLEGRSLLSLFEPGDDYAALERHLAELTPFRDLLVRLRIEGETRYWRLTAHPRSDGRISGVARDVTDDRLSEERVAFMAHFDSLTGLANRYLFNDRLATALTARGARGSNLALFYLDLDDFKAVNDTRGHLVGDRLLREVANRLEQEVRPEDLVARLGGDEFAILIETRAGVGMLIERAHRFLSAVREPVEIDGQLYRVSTSVGVARCSEGECDAQELMRRADLALFAAKRKGRDTLAIFEPALDREARERRDLETDLRDAVARSELRVHYQPVIDLDSGATTGYEALLRWHHPRRGLIPPADFLPIAEETGLIVPIGEWVIRQALAETAGWAGDFRIAINLSPTQVRSPYLVSLVAQAIHASGMPAERVEFEITEHVLMQEGDVVPAALDRLRELGTRIALDDFGTGYSSLSYLRRFPFDRIKIDRKFVEHIVEDTDSQAIVSSITRLADALGMQTTAEGIETRRQLDLLRKLGCNEAQGFLICEPAPAETFATPEAAEAAMIDHGPDVLDYRKAREAALRRRDGEVA
ncbi:EAL domain-containing protein [Qipengyuania sp. 6B39]|uniref:putative bifunctional diguanylate cyclase/phosphodiesterase n=1 Tax=Qipengyuania proteolytica TaxID=2867239 RepID=UPI001C8A0D75|nr:EAL domain-containing protein [Qipengyuania proteolytica]MBX7494351.1 EAL domain-containing protein [Qipengyuania proteolytica]